MNAFITSGAGLAKAGSGFTIEQRTSCIVTVMAGVSSASPVCSLIRVDWPGGALGVPEVCAVHLLLWCDSGRRFTGGHGIASHRLLESWCREDEGQGDRFGADVLSTDPGIRGDEHQPSGMEIALLIAEPHVGRSALDQQDFILNQMPVFGQRRSRSKQFRPGHKMPGAVILRAHLQHELG
jgi:hypothetical protein